MKFSEKIKNDYKESKNMLLKFFIWVWKNLISKVEYKIDVFLQNAWEKSDDEKENDSYEDRIKDSSQ